MGLTLNNINKFKDIVLFCISSYPYKKHKNKDNLYQTFVREFMELHIFVLSQDSFWQHCNL